MSAFIGEIQSPYHNSPSTGSPQGVWVSKASVEINIAGVLIQQDPIAARNFAALLVRAADECERMRARAAERCAEAGCVLDFGHDGAHRDFR